MKFHLTGNGEINTCRLKSSLGILGNTHILLLFPSTAFEFIKKVLREFRFSFISFHHILVRLSEGPCTDGSITVLFL